MNKLFTKKKLISGILLAVLTLTMCSCGSSPKNFTVSNMTITLNNNFEKGVADQFDIYVKSENVIFTAVEETEDELENAGYEINSIDDYTDEILSLNKASKNDLVVRDNYRYFVTTDTKQGAKYTYVHCITASKSAYWVCEFACKSKSYDKYKSDIFKWADSITFSE